MPVKWDDLRDAHEFVSVEGPSDHRAWLSKASGKIYWDFEGEDFDEEEEDEASDDSDDHENAGRADDDDPDELPRDINNAEKYLPIPSKRDLDLGSRLVFRFVQEALPDDYNEVARIFEKRGAYARFKALLTRRKALDQWYAFEEKVTQDALREWSEDNAIEIEEPPARPKEQMP